MDLEKLEASLREMGFTDTDDEFIRLMAAATPADEEEASTEETTPEAREAEVNAETAANAVDDAAAARASQAATEVDAGGLRSLLDDATREIETLNERIGDLDSFRANYEARYGVLTSDEDEASARASQAEADAPLASDEEFREANNYELSVGLFRSVMSRWAERHGDAPVPEGVTPTANSLAYVRRVQGTRLAGEAPSFR